MSSGKADGQVTGVFKVQLEHIPRTKSETYKRLHYYVAKMGVTVSDQLQEALINLRRNAHSIADPELQKLALKGYGNSEFVAAVKQLLCIWLHLEAIDQDGEHMPGWLLTFLRLSFGATDYMIPNPGAVDVMMSYENCHDLNSLCLQTAVSVATTLGFGDYAMMFSPTIGPIVMQTSALRQQILQKALTLPIEVILASHNV